jgi:hypothetical protein
MSMITLVVHSPAGFACEPAARDLVPGTPARLDRATPMELPTKSPALPQSRLTRSPNPSHATATAPEDACSQADLCFAKIAAILVAAGMTLSDTIRINAYVTDRAHMKFCMASRDAAARLDADHRLGLHPAGVQGRD